MTWRVGFTVDLVWLKLCHDIVDAIGNEQGQARNFTQ